MQVRLGEDEDWRIAEWSFVEGDEKWSLRLMTDGEDGRKTSQ